MATGSGIWLLAALAQASPAAALDPMAQVQTELQTLISEINQARQDGNREALERLYAPEFVRVGPTGYSHDRARQIDALFEANVDLPPQNFASPATLIVHGDIALLRQPAQRSRVGLEVYITTTFLRRNGRWQVLHVQATRKLPEREWVAMPTPLLDALQGRYRNATTGTEMELRRAGNTLEAFIPDLPRHVLRPVDVDRFYDVENETEYVFERDPDGHARAFSFRLLSGREGRSYRVD